MDEATGVCGRRLLQPVSGSDFDFPGYRYGSAGVALPTRGAETEGRLIASPDIRDNLDRDVLAGLVHTLPRTPGQSRSAPLAPGCRIRGRLYLRANWSSGRLPERRKRTKLGTCARNRRQATKELIAFIGNILLHVRFYGMSERSR